MKWISCLFAARPSGFISSLILASLISPTAVWSASLSDVSVLLPLPVPADFNQMLSPIESGPQGSLLPAEVYQHLPQLLVETDNREIYSSQLRVVAIRLDPCFTEGAGPQKCRRQIRLVWQPIANSARELSAADAAVHTFYEFEDRVWESLLQNWQAMASGNPSDPLQVHPLLNSQTLRGVYWQNLRSLVLQNCGKGNLVRVTSMTLRGNQQVWTFQGFDIVQGQPQNILIPRVQSFVQLAALNTRVVNEFFGGINPPPLDDSDFVSLIRDSVVAKRNLAEPTLQAVLSKVFAFENPRIHNPGTLDCVSCHMAESARRWGQLYFKAWDWNRGFQNRYPNPWFRGDGALTPFKPNQFRAFGYFGRESVISQRVTNESIEVLNSLKW